MHVHSLLYMCITTFSFLIKMFSLNHTNKLTHFESSCTQNKIKKICFQNVISDTINRLISRNFMRLTDKQFCNRFLCDFLLRKDLQTCSCHHILSCVKLIFKRSRSRSWNTNNAEFNARSI